MQQIVEWLQKLGLGQYAHRFAENDITFVILRDLTDQDLEKIGVASLGHRRQLLRAIGDLKGEPGWPAGDLLIVTRLDRLARSTRDLLNILHQLAEKGAKFKSLHDPWCDTSTPQGELLVTILAGFATFERHLIKARTDEGRKRAEAVG